MQAETRDLQLLLTLEAARTLHAAARQLHVSPSALSQQLRGLEQRLGGPLFDRRARRLTPTAAGQRFTAGARHVLAELELLEREVVALLGGATATLRLAMSCHQSYRWLPRVLARFAELEPKVELALVADAAAAPFEWLLERRLDVALVTGKAPRDRRLQAKRLFRDELVVVVGTSHPWAARRRVQPRDFASEQLFGDARLLDAREPLGRALAKARVSPRKKTEVPMSGNIALDFVRAGLGVTLLPRWTVAAQLRAGDLALLHVGQRGLWLDWHLATRREPASPALERLLGILRAEQPGHSSR